ncbi:hypothetical protein Mal52_20790 [Symmachiella dynata]|uniref:Uncharacterized protein n=1 Tax=Symmachiella dynata TaxID=2527995 RepID=A0A517ZM94_9PLAN|nr:hypothetical protein Mal52_20790 [Symmachiella dynata]
MFAAAGSKCPTAGRLVLFVHNLLNTALPPRYRPPWQKLRKSPENPIPIL